MILKALTRKAGSGQLVKYILRYAINPEKQATKQKGSRDKNKSSKHFIIRHNIRSSSIEGYIKEFKQNELGRIHKRTNQTAINHFIISFSPEDSRNLNDKKLRTIAKKFIQLHGENNLYIGSKHLDKEHVHLHIACSGTQINGKSSRISKAAMAILKVEMDLFQKERFPELVSLPRHGLSKALKTDYRVNEGLYKRRGKVSQKEELLKSLGLQYEKANSLYGFLTVLRTVGYEPYYRGGRLTGIKYGERKFRLSRLGYDELKISGLQVKQERMSRELTSLRTIRNRSQVAQQAKEDQENIRIREFGTQRNSLNGNVGQSVNFPMPSPFKTEGIGILPLKSILGTTAISPG